MRRHFAALALTLPSLVAAQPSEVTRYAMDSNFPIAAAVEVPATANLVFFSGNVPPALDGGGYSDGTEAQTRDVLAVIESNLKKRGLGLGDVIKMQVYLVGDPAHEGKMDFAGFMRGYNQYFGTKAQPQLPARSVFQVAGLADPRWLVEIEVIAVRTQVRASADE